MLVRSKKDTALPTPLLDLQERAITERGLWKCVVLQEVIWLPETFFSLLVSILPDKMDIS